MFLSSSTIILIIAEEIATAVQDRDIIDLIKENILQDKKREDEYVRLLKYYINLHIIHQKGTIETGSSQEKDMLTSSDKINDNYESLIAKNKKDEHGDEILDDNDSTLRDENNHVVRRENNYDVSSIFYKNCEKDDISQYNQPIDNKWITVRRKKIKAS